MADYLKLLDKGSGLIGLQDDLELIRSLVELATHWPELKTHVTGIDSLEAFLSSFVAHVDDPKIKEAFEKTGQAKLVALHSKLVGLLKKLQDAAGEVPDEIKLLLSPISRFNGPDATEDGALAWTPIDKTEKFGEGGDFSFEVGGSAKLSLAGGEKVKLGGAEKKLLKIAAELGIHAKVGATPPFQPVKVNGEFKGSASADLAYYFDPGSGASLYGFEVAERLPALPNPFDFDAVWRAFASPKLGLAQLRYAVDGTAKASITLSAAKSISFGPDLVADLSLSFSADASITAKYLLTLSAGDALPAGPDGAPARKIDVALTRKRLSDAGLALGLGVDIDASKFAKRIQAEAQKAVDKWDSVLKEVKPFLSPGTLIQSKASELLGKEAERLIEDEDLRKAVVRDLRGLIGVDTSSTPALVDWLKEEITGAIDATRGVLTDRVDAATDRVLATLGNRLPAMAQAEIEAKLKPAIQGLIEKAESELTALVDDLLKRPADALGKALKTVGIEAGDAGATLDKALASVRTVIERFDKVIHDTVKELGNSARAKITAKIQAEERRASEETFEIVGTLIGSGETAEKVFHALTRGKPADLRRLLASDDPNDDFLLDPAKSRMRRYSKRIGKIGWEVVAFGFAASGHAIASGEALVVLAGDGEVQVDSKAVIEKLFTGRRESRKVSFVESFALLRAKIEGAAADKTRTIDLGVTITHHDDSLKLGEMQGFLESLEDRGLLPAEVLSRANEHFARWAGGNGENAKLKADIAAKLWLDLGQAKTLMQLDARRADGRLKREAAIRIVRAADKAVRETGALRISLDRYNQAVGTVRDVMYRSGYPKAAPREEIIWDMLTPSEREGADTPGELVEAWPSRLPIQDGGIHLDEDVQDLLGEHDGEVTGLRGQFHNLVEMIDIMGQIYLAQPENLGEASPLGWQQPTYEAKQFELATRGAGWLRTGGKLLFWIDRKVQPWTVALLCTLADLGRGSRDGAMSLTMTHKDEASGKPETIDLSNG